MREQLVDEAGVRRLVQAFYERVRDDDLLGPVFEARLSTDWDHHLDRMVAFWSGVLLGRPGFRGDPVGVHRAIPGLGPHHFDRWLDLFGATLEDVVPGPAAADILARASRMRVVLEGPAAVR